jgi:hypothetical protein
MKKSKIWKPLVAWAKKSISKKVRKMILCRIAQTIQRIYQEKGIRGCLSPKELFDALKESQQPEGCNICNVRVEQRGCNRVLCFCVEHGGKQVLKFKGAATEYKYLMSLA